MELFMVCLVIKIDQSDYSMFEKLKKRVEIDFRIRILRGGQAQERFAICNVVNF